MEDEYLTLIEAINSSDTTKVYTLDVSEVITQDVDSMGGTSLTINGSTNTVTGDGVEGIVIQQGQTLNILNVSNWSGFVGNGTRGAINNAGTVVIEDSTFSQNRSQHGDVIYNNSSGVITVIDSIIRNNGKIEEILSAFAHGSIFNAGTATITNVDFTDNRTGAGGGIYNTGDATVVDCNFLRNYSRQGGAIDSEDGSTLTLRRCVFDANRGANNGAGAIRLFNANTYIYDSEFRNHYEVLEDPESPYYDRQNGGVIYYYDSGYEYDAEGNVIGFISEPGVLLLEDTVFEDNTVSRGGGAVYSNSQVIATDVTFRRNHSDVSQGEDSAGTGGALYCYNRANYFYDNKYSILTRVNFLSNTAYTGGAIYHAIGRLDIIDSLFQDNEAVRSAGFAGAILVGEDTITNITNTRFINNSTLGAGGAIASIGGSLNIKDSLFEDNSANPSGGAIKSFTSDEITIEPVVTIDNTIFRRNSAGSVIDNEYTLNILNCTFENNNGVLIDNNDTVVVRNTNISNNVGEVINAIGLLTLTDSSISNTSGVAVSCRIDTYNGNNCIAHIYNCVIDNNSTSSTSEYGVGGLVSNESVLVIKNSTITNNSFNNATTTGNAFGGGIINSGVISLIADDGDFIFRGNVSNGTSAGIYTRTADNPINLYAGSNNETVGKFIFDDSIVLIRDGVVNINPTNSEGYPTDGVVNINDTIKLGGTISHSTRATLNLQNGVIQFGNATVDYGEGNVQSIGGISNVVNFNVNGGAISTIDDRIGETNLGLLVLNSNVNFKLDVNLSNSTCDTLTYDSFTDNGNSIIIDEINVVANGEEGEINIQITNDVNLRNVIRFSDNVRFTTSSGIFGRYEMTNYNSSTGVLTINYTYMEEQILLYSYGRPVIDFPNAQVIYYYGVKIWEREQSKSWQDYGERGEYIQNVDTNSYIRLNNVVNEDTIAEITFVKKSFTDVMWLFGSRTAYLKNQFYIVASSTDFNIGYSDIVSRLVDIYSEIQDGSIVSITIDKSKIIINDVEIVITPSEYSYVNNMCIFALNVNNSTITYSADTVSIVNFKVSGHDLIPLNLTKQPITDAAGRVHEIGSWVMYDTITNTVPAHYGTFIGAAVESGDTITYGSNNDVVTYGTNNDTVIY